MSIVLAVMFVAGFLLVPIEAPADETIFVVDSEVDAIDLIPGDGVCETAAGACTLRAAIMEANALQAFDEEARFVVQLPAGTFELSLPGPEEDASLTGDLDICFEGALRGAGRDETTIAGDGSDRVLEIGSCSSAGSPPRNPFTISHVRIVGGRSPGRGGGLLWSSTQRPDLQLSDCSFHDNTADGAGGGIALSGPFPSLAMIRCAVTNNTAAERGGGIAILAASGAALISESVVAFNSADFGGGIAFDELFPLELVRTVISGNSASTLGGGIFADRAQLNLISSTVSGNSAPLGGGIYSQGMFSFEMSSSTVVQNEAVAVGNLQLAADSTQFMETFWASNSVLASGAAAESPDCLVLDTGPGRPTFLQSRGFNVLGDVSGCNFIQDGGDLVGTPDSPVDPMLSAQRLVGGLPSTFAPLPGSPTIDAGSPEEPGTSDSACAPTDGRGVSRPRDGNGDGEARCDIGAHELAAAVDVMPRQYDFGFVALGDAVLQLVTISSAGDAPLLLEEIVLDAAVDSGFALGAVPLLPILLDPGESVEIGVTFAPSAPGSVGGTLRIASSDADELEVAVLLTGFGVDHHEQAMALLVFFDAAVASGDLVGDGPGNSAAGRLRALRNMIEASGDLLEQGRVHEACRQLEDARRRTDGAFPPPDFAGGAAAPDLEAAIADLRTDLECEELGSPAPGGVPGCGLGAELVLLLPLLRSCRRRRH